MAAPRRGLFCGFRGSRIENGWGMKYDVGGSHFDNGDNFDVFGDARRVAAAAVCALPPRVDCA